MAREDMIMASQEELRRLHVIRKVEEKVIKQVEAGEILCLSLRQVGEDRKASKGRGGRRGHPSIPGEVFQPSLCR